MSKFDALALPVEQTARCFLVHPVKAEPLCDDDGNQAYIDLCSSDSETARKFNRAVSRRRLNMPRGGRLSPEELEADQFGLLAELTAGWHLVGLDGKRIDVELTKVNARELYSAPGTAWIFDQVNEFTAARVNFSKPLLKI